MCARAILFIALFWANQALTQGFAGLGTIDEWLFAGFEGTDGVFKIFQMSTVINGLGIGGPGTCGSRFGLKFFSGFFI